MNFKRDSPPKWLEDMISAEMMMKDAAFASICSEWVPSWGVVFNGKQDEPVVICLKGHLLLKS